VLSWVAETRSIPSKISDIPLQWFIACERWVSSQRIWPCRLSAHSGFDCISGPLQLHKVRLGRRSAHRNPSSQKTHGWWGNLTCMLRASWKCSYQIRINLASFLEPKWSYLDCCVFGPLENSNRPVLATKRCTIFEWDLSRREPLPPILTVTRSLERNFSNLKKLAEFGARSSWATFRRLRRYQ